MLWAGFLALIVALLAIDLGVFHRKSHEVSLREATIWTAVWIGFGVAFTGVVYFIYENEIAGSRLVATDGEVLEGGAQAALQYLTGYVLEKSLSVDNIFIIALVFDTFGVKGEYRHRVLFWGILGALVSRAAMIFGGVWLVTKFSWVFYLFGAYLVYTGAKLIRSGDEEVDPEQSFFVKAARKLFPISTGDHHGKFTTRVDGRLMFTPLALVLVVIEGTDVIFALDSIPAILAITTESFIVFTSNIFAILGLRSLYFVLHGALDKFAFLKVSLAFILIFIGAKMGLHGFVKIPTLLSLAVIVLAVTLGIVASLRVAGNATRRPAPSDPGE